MDAGNLPGLRWPNFSDYRVHLKNFYEPAGYVLAWVRDGHPTPQAVAITEVFQNADRKGLVPYDYDSPRWPNGSHACGSRILRLRTPTSPASIWL